ncbi:Serine/threonine-protein kinase WNK (With No Lysine)-like protein [Rhynchospora pubera]|uniref:Serine/threonine-protein kinase WNK (With No Lysine)-like protein n=1 Tax=Rhynchospora pubera TaxID=906938 RepID=A0AAV8H0P7_9POAL|nr:Serine/threonine-protein kinase WNK (With No Lysine)-like protein [Rhynchospora pubera]
MDAMEEQLNPLAVTHLLQHTLRSLCLSESSQWVYAVFWRILPRNYPPPKWDLHVSAGVFDRSRGNKRNWILAWEDGFCNFTASTIPLEYKSDDVPQLGLQPEIFFKMSHEIYNFGEGVIGKVASDYSHKWIFNEPGDNETNNIIPSWNNPADFYPRTWEAQFQSGIKTIALISVREGVVQLGSPKKVEEDPSFILLLRKKFAYLESIPGVLLPHPASPAFPLTADNMQVQMQGYAQQMEFCENQQLRIMPSINSLDALLSKLPAVGPTSGQVYGEMPVLMAAQKQEMERSVLKEEIEVIGGETSSSMNYLVNAANSMQ